eukprot:m.91896 g.91896  ORF g.91896 m.91896 type:complete len:777 (-) comp8882_c0_seq1:277-2607(-)
MNEFEAAIKTLPRNGWDVLESSINTNLPVSSWKNCFSRLVDILPKPEWTERVLSFLRQSVLSHVDADIEAQFCDVGFLEALDTIDIAALSVTSRSTLVDLLGIFHASSVFAHAPLVLDLLHISSGSETEILCSLISSIYFDNPFFESGDINKRFCKVFRKCNSVVAQEAIISSVLRMREGKIMDSGGKDILSLALEEFDHSRCVKPAVEFFKNAVFGPVRNRYYIAEVTAQHGLVRTLTHNLDLIRWQTCDLLRNVCMAGEGSLRCKTAIARAGVLPLLVTLLEDDENTVKLHASYALWNTSSCPTGANIMVRDNLFRRVLTIYDNLTFDFSINGDSLKSKLVGVLCCVAFHCSDAECEVLRRANLQSYLHPLVSSTNPLHQPVNSALGLARLVGHEENNPLLDANTSIFNLFISCFESARRGAAFHGAMFTEELLMPSIARLSVSDSNKELLISTGCFEVACKNFKVGKDVVVDEGLARLLANMSFKYNLRHDFSFGCVSIVTDIKEKSPSKQARADAQVALFQLDLREQQKEQQQLVRKLMANTHILLSCASSHLPLANKIQNGLEFHGQKCMIPELSSSSFSLMAETVERACVVIAFVSKAYKQASECRSLSEYAIALAKPIIVLRVDEQYKPDGWVKDVEDRATLSLQQGEEEDNVEQLCKDIEQKVLSLVHDRDILPNSKEQIAKVVKQQVQDGKDQELIAISNIIEAQHLPMQAHLLLAEVVKAIDLAERDILASVFTTCDALEKRMETITSQVLSLEQSKWHKSSTSLN